MQLGAAQIFWVPLGPQLLWLSESSLETPTVVVPEGQQPSREGGRELWAVVAPSHRLLARAACHLGTPRALFAWPLRL